VIDVINEACAPAGGGAQQGTGATSAIAHDVKARQLAALNALLADLHRRGDFEEASKVRTPDIAAM
jgi:protein-arginine kinase activator protein McsA